eukprot:c53336_g1_i1 orf=61-750(-)
MAGQGGPRAMDAREAARRVARGGEEGESSLKSSERLRCTNQKRHSLDTKKPAESHFHHSAPQRGRSETYQQTEDHRATQGTPPYNSDYEYPPWRASRDDADLRLLCAMHMSYLGYRFDRQLLITSPDQSGLLANPQVMSSAGPQHKQQFGEPKQHEFVDTCVKQQMQLEETTVVPQSQYLDVSVGSWPRGGPNEILNAPPPPIFGRRGHGRNNCGSQSPEDQTSELGGH